MRLQSINASASPEVQMNENAEAVEAACTFGINRATTTGLMLGIYGGVLHTDGVAAVKSNSTIALTASQTNYVERTRDGTVSKNTTGFSADKIPLYTATTNTTAITAVQDYRDFGERFQHARVGVTVTTADVTLTAAQARVDEIKATGTLTGNRAIIVPAVAWSWIVDNATGGAYNLTVKTASGSGVVITQGKRMLVHCDGTNVVASVTDRAALESVNDIGVAGAQGFGVGIYHSTLPSGFAEMSGTRDRASDNYGNYQYSDGSVMCWIPAFYYKFGTGANGLAINAIDIKPESGFANEAAANTAGYALHRAFYDGGAVKRGFFVDKYLCSNNSGTASSIKNGNPLSSHADHNPFAGLTGAPTNAYYGAIAAAQTRGANFFCSSRFIFAALALLAYAHARASAATTWCAWYDATNNFPKGCNDNALGDAQDTSLNFTSDGYSNAAKTGSADLFAKTTHNGQNCGVCDLNGGMWEITPGLATETAGTTYYVLKTSVTMKNMTGGVGGALDLWGTAGQLAAHYDSLGATYEEALASSTAKLYGSATQVLSAATSGNAWQWAGLGGPLASGVGGTNPFGNDGFWDYRPGDLCPLSGGYWGSGSYAGVWAFYLLTVRGSSTTSVGFRAASYL